MADLAMPGMRMQRLSSYRRGPEATRRFAALYYDDGAIAGSSRSWLVDADADAATAAAHGGRAAGVSVDVVPGGGEVRFTLILDPHPNPDRTLRTDLSADALTALLDGDHAVVDFDTYLRDGTRVFAAVIERRADQGSSLFPGLAQDAVRTTLGPRGVLPTRVRTYHSPVGWRAAVVGEHVPRHGVVGARRCRCR